MNETQLFTLAIDAASDLHNIKENSAKSNDLIVEVRELLQELTKPQDPTTLASLDQPLVETARTANGFEGMSAYEADSLQFMYMQTITGFVIAAALMLSLGVQLFQIFNKHWS